MDIVLPISSNPVSEAAVGGVLGFLVPFGVVVAYVVSSRAPRHLRITTAVVGTMISLFISLMMWNVQASVIVRGDTLTIHHLLGGDVNIRREDIVAVSEVRLKGVSELSLQTQSDRYGIKVQGELVKEMGDAIARQVGLVYAPENGLQRWVRQQPSP